MAHEASQMAQEASRTPQETPKAPPDRVLEATIVGKPMAYDFPLIYIIRRKKRRGSSNEAQDGSKTAQAGLKRASRRAKTVPTICRSSPFEQLRSVSGRVAAKHEESRPKPDRWLDVRLLWCPESNHRWGRASGRWLAQVPVPDRSGG